MSCTMNSTDSPWGVEAGSEKLLITSGFTNDGALFRPLESLLPSSKYVNNKYFLLFSVTVLINGE